MIESYTITTEYCGDHGIEAQKRPRRKGKIDKEVQTNGEEAEREKVKDEETFPQLKVDFSKNLKGLARRLAIVTENLPALPSMIWAGIITLEA